MLEAYKGNCASVYDELSGVCSSDTDHQDYVYVRVDFQKGFTLVLGVSGQRHHVHPLEHCAEIHSSSERGGLHHLGEMRTIGLYDVIRPVGFEETAVVVEVAVICRDAIGAVQDCEEIGQQVDQHQQPGSCYGVERDALKGCEKIR